AVHISSFFTGHGVARDLHSFPTRRSSDLAEGKQFGDIHDRFLYPGWLLGGIQALSRCAFCYDGPASAADTERTPSHSEKTLMPANLPRHRKRFNNGCYPP